LLFASATGNGAAADLAVVGTGDGLEVLRAVGAAYTADHPETAVWVPPSVRVHSSGGISAVRSGTAVLGRIARPLSIEERAEGIIEVQVFRLPSVFIINPAAKVRNLTADQATLRGQPVGCAHRDEHRWREATHGGDPDVRWPRFTARKSPDRVAQSAVA
jgi:ABC-type phosphate transport system substrate-binding protein